MLSQEKRDLVLEMYRQGESLRNITAKTGASPTTINRLRKAAGLSRGSPVGVPTSSTVDGDTRTTQTTAEVVAGRRAMLDLIPPELEEKMATKKEAQERKEEASAADEVYGCPECSTKWTLDPGEEQVTACPRCGAVFA